MSKFIQDMDRFIDTIDTLSEKKRILKNIHKYLRDAKQASTSKIESLKLGGVRVDDESFAEAIRANKVDYVEMVRYAKEKLLSIEENSPMHSNQSESALRLRRKHEARKNASRAPQARNVEPIPPPVSDWSLDSIIFYASRECVCCRIANTAISKRFRSKRFRSVGEGRGDTSRGWAANNRRGAAARDRRAGSVCCLESEGSPQPLCSSRSYPKRKRFSFHIRA
jgi:hypothetical protein